MTLTGEQITGVIAIVGALLFFERRLAKVEARIEILVRRCMGAVGTVCDEGGAGD